MRKLFTAFIVTAAILPLGGCLTFQAADIPGIITNVITTGKIPSINPAVDAKVNETISEVQSVATRLCGFLPLASTVGGIIGTLAGAGAITETATSIAQSICTAVARPGARRGGQLVVKVHGVPLQGQFVR